MKKLQCIVKFLGSFPGELRGKAVLCPVLLKLYRRSGEAWELQVSYIPEISESQVESAYNPGIKEKSSCGKEKKEQGQGKAQEVT
jgi:hypothetical protein